AIYQLTTLRDPSWRLLTGLGLALFTRAIVSDVPEPGLPGVFIWLGRSFVPGAIGVGLWWRGGALAVAELTPAEVRTEFSVLAICTLATLALVRPFLLPDPMLLGGSVGLFVVGGLMAAALARQDAASVATPRHGRALAVATGLAPAGAAVALTAGLRPELVGNLWVILARGIELALTPIGLLIAWLASLFPRTAGSAPPVALPRPTPLPLNTAALADAQERVAWVAWVIAVTLLIFFALAALLAARLLLANWIGAPIKDGRPREEALVAERSGTPGSEAADMLGWLVRWLRRRFRRARPSSPRGPTMGTGAADAWAAYAGLLSWAELQGLGRRPWETTGQLSARLARHAPEAANAVDLVTHAYEWQRYGAIYPAHDHLRRVQAALAALVATSR
ncbi:MAG TPA: DUF4129 domain-containing protein, partial [Chloroflexota bacterium]